MDEKTDESQASAGQVERPVRPVAYVQRMGSYQGVPAYGCLLTIEAGTRMKVNDPLYGQAELDAAVALERERVTPFGMTASQHLAEVVKWMETRRERLHHEGCSVHAPSARCNCGLHKALTDLRAAHTALEPKA